MRLARRVLTCCAIVLAILTYADVASACSCIPREVPASFSNAQLVVLARVTAIRVVDGHRGLLRVQAEVLESFKGGDPSIPSVIYTQMSGASCYGYDFHVGRQYVIFASSRLNLPGAASAPVVPPNGLLAWLCGGTAEIGHLHGTQALAELRRMRRK